MSEKEEVISLREVLETIWAGKKIIVISVAVMVLLASFISFYVMDKMYESKATIQVTNNANANVNEKVMQYITGEFSPVILVERLNYPDDINSHINVKKLNTIIRTDGTLLDISYKANNPSDAQTDLSKHLETTIEKMSKELKVELLQQSSYYKEESTKVEKELQSLIESYNSIIQTNNLSPLLIMQTLLPEETMFTLTGEQEQEFGKIDGELQTQLMSLQSNIKSKSEEYALSYTDLQNFLSNAEQFNPKSFIKTINQPSMPTKPSSPSPFLNIAIGFVIGLLVGLALVFFRNYWIQSAPSK